MIDPKRIGHTGITWVNEAMEKVIADVAAVGFPAFETFGNTLEQFPGGIGAFRDILQRNGVRYAASYCGRDYIDASKAQEHIEAALNWARLTKEAGGETVVVACGGRQGRTFARDDYLALARTWSELGARIRDQFGMATAVHPHTGTPVETPEEIQMVLDALDPDACGFGPDTGQIQQGGGDAVAVVRQYRELVRHVHVKDYGGVPVKRNPDGTREDPTGYVGYVPVGSGMIDFRPMLRDLDDAGCNGWLMVELDGTPRSPRPAKEAAEMSYRGLLAAIAAVNRELAGGRV